ncbi:MAG: hypothetical protein O3B13_12490 [Planctomycetota bacterium]|nr:hypothetical protein [Planctomycetota bacterium]
MRGRIVPLVMLSGDGIPTNCVVKAQHKSGGNAGNWDAKDNWEISGDRVYATSIKLLMLDIYYRHLPLYDQLEF